MYLAGWKKNRIKQQISKQKLTNKQTDKNKLQNYFITETCLIQWITGFSQG